MKYNKSGIPANVETYINLHAKKLIRSKVFLPGELEDIKQELWLYYYEKLFPERSKMSEDFIFISIKGTAKHILRSRLKKIQAGLFFTDTLNGMLDDTCKECELGSSTNTDDVLLKREIQSKLNETENKAFELALQGYTSREIAKMLHVSDHILNRLEEKMKKIVK